MSERICAVGLKAHTGWAHASVVAVERDELRVLAKRRIEMLEGFTNAAVYHHAYEGGLDARAAKPIIDRAFAVALKRAIAELGALFLEVQAAAQEQAQPRVQKQERMQKQEHERGQLHSFRVAHAAVLIGSGKPLPELSAIISSHPLVHTAEGVMYREVCAKACESLGCTVHSIGEKSLASSAPARLGLEEKTLLAALAKAGKASGRPWGLEQRACALAAWVALSSPA